MDEAHVDPVRVVVVDDVAAVRLLLAHRLPFFGSFTVVGEAADADEALRAVAKERPDLVILDHLMPGRTGLEVAPLLRREAPRIRIVLYTGADTITPAEARRAGVDAVVDKTGPNAELENVLTAMFRRAAPAPAPAAAPARR